MQDLACLVIVVVFFGSTLLLVKGVDLLKGG